MPVELNVAETPDFDGQPRRLIRAEGHDLALAWIAAAVGGGALISLLPESVGVARMMAPLAAMGGYFYFAWTRSLRNTPKIADSVYFMGFLWTLWALIDVLVFSRQLTAAQLYEAFGYALIATASGMFLRLSVLQFYKTADDQAVEATDAIDTQVVELARELQLSIASLAEFRRAASKEFSTGSAAVRTNFAELESAIVVAAAKIASANDRLPSSLDSLGAVVLQASSSLSSAHQGLVGKIREIEIPPDLVKSSLAATNRDLTALADTLRLSLGSAFGAFATAIASVDEAARSLASSDAVGSSAQRLAAALSASTTSCAAAGKALADSTTALNQLNGALAQFHSTAARNTERIETSADHLREQLGQIAASASHVDANVKRVDSALKDVVGFVQRNVSN